MITGAALATTNRIPVLLFPSDQFANRIPDPVLQQLESPQALDTAVTDCFARSRASSTGSTGPSS